MKISICIPAYNRAKHLSTLLESISSQDFSDFEILICEDFSPERQEIQKIVESFKSVFVQNLRYHENEVNLGYDANIRRLIELASGEYCFFMGNDDLMKPGALAAVAGVLQENPNAGVIVKAYEWFIGDPKNVQQVIKYVSEKKVVPAGEQAIVAAFRRAGVISGFIIRREDAAAVADARFDGSLYYQMYVTGAVLARREAVFIPTVLVSCRGDEPPEFGSSAVERGKYVPGKYTPEARFNMISSVLKIAEYIENISGIIVRNKIMKDYANYFYPYIRDQLKLPLRDYIILYRNFGGIGFNSYPAFHFYIIVSYILGETAVDKITNYIRRLLGRTPNFGGVL